MQNSKLQCPNNKSCKLKIMQTRLVAKYQPLPYANEAKEKTRLTLRKTGLKKTIPKKSMVNKENQTNRLTQFVAVNPMEAQLCKNSTNKIGNQVKKHLLPSPKLRQFGSSQQFTGAIRKIVISNKSTLKRRSNKDVMLASRKECSDFVPQPSAFVHILSAFISSSFETNFNYGQGSLASLRALSRMLEDVPEENDAIYESSFTKPKIALSPPPKKTIATNVSPIEFSLDKSSSTTAQSIVDEENITILNNNESVDGPSPMCPISKNVSPKCEIGNHEIISVCGSTRNLTRVQSESINGNEKATQDSITVVSENMETAPTNDSFQAIDCQIPSRNSTVKVEEAISTNPVGITASGENLTPPSFQEPHSNLPNNLEVEQNLNQKPSENNAHDAKEILGESSPECSGEACQRIESIFRSDCIGGPSKETCSLSCPCLRELDKYYLQSTKYYCLTANDGNQDDLEIKTNSEASRNDESDDVCEDKKNGECTCKNCVSPNSDTTVAHEGHLENTTTNAEDFNYNVNKSKKDEERTVRREFLRLSLSLPNQKIRKEYIKDQNDKKRIITLYSKNKNKKEPTLVENRNMNKVESFNNNWFGDMTSFKDEVLNFFESTQRDDSWKEVVDEIGNISGGDNEDLTIPSVKLVVPNFSEIMPDIGRTTEEKINQFVEEAQEKRSSGIPHECDVKKLILLFMK